MSTRDAYLHGHGSVRGTMLGHVLHLINGTGPEYDVSELVTYLNDRCSARPACCCTCRSPGTEAGDRCFDLTLRDRRHRVTARVFIDDQGAPVDFSAEDRWCDLPGGLARVRWTTPSARLPRRAAAGCPPASTAIWHLPGGDFSYAEFCLDPVRPEVQRRPGLAAHPGRRG